MASGLKKVHQGFEVDVNIVLVVMKVTPILFWFLALVSNSIHYGPNCKTWTEAQYNNEPSIA